MSQTFTYIKPLAVVKSPLFRWQIVTSNWMVCTVEGNTLGYNLAAMNGRGWHASFLLVERNCW
jgi:hypothetical protein